MGIHHPEDNTNLQGRQVHGNHKTRGHTLVWGRQDCDIPHKTQGRIREHVEFLRNSTVTKGNHPGNITVIKDRDDQPQTHKPISENHTSGVMSSSPRVP